MKKKSKIWFSPFVLMGLFLIIVSSCKKDEQTSIPTLTTGSISQISEITATCGGNISSDGGSPVTERGVCWGTSQTPTYESNKSSDGSGIGDFTSSIAGLTPNTTYYIRAYAKNAHGTAYGNEVSFTTKAQAIVVDIDGNVYHTITIGNQVWMVENLKTTKYRNGDLIGTTSPATLDISEVVEAKYQWAYAGNENNVADYGRLYTWYAINDSRKICPAGWHVPTLQEWSILIDYFGGEDAAGNQLQNAMGFKALMGGYRYYTDHFLQLSTFGHWWTLSESDSEYAYKIQLEYQQNGIVTSEFFKNYGLSVRCIKD